MAEEEKDASAPHDTREECVGNMWPLWTIIFSIHERPPTSVSLPDFCYPHALGEVMDYIEHENYQYFQPPGTFSDGDLGFHLADDRADGLGHLARSEGSLFSYPYIHPRSRDLLGLAFQGETFRFCALPFGLRLAPREMKGK